MRDPVREHDVSRDPVREQEVPRDPVREQEVPRDPVREQEVPRDPVMEPGPCLKRLKCCLLRQDSEAGRHQVMSQSNIYKKRRLLRSRN